MQRHKTTHSLKLNCILVALFQFMLIHSWKMSTDGFTKQPSYSKRVLASIFSNGTTCTHTMSFDHHVSTECSHVSYAIDSDHTCPTALSLAWMTAASGVSFMLTLSWWGLSFWQFSYLIFSQKNSFFELSSRISLGKTLPPVFNCSWNSFFF